MKKSRKGRCQGETVPYLSERGFQPQMGSQKPNDIARERRRMQNKLAQRKHRERQKLILEASKSADAAVESGAESVPPSATASEFSSNGSEWTLGDVEDYLHLEKTAEQFAANDAFIFLPTIPQPDIPLALKVSSSPEAITLAPDESIAGQLQPDMNSVNPLLIQNSVGYPYDIPLDPKLSPLSSYPPVYQPDLYINTRASTPTAAYYEKWGMTGQYALDRSNQLQPQMHHAQELNAPLLQNSSRKSVLHVAVENGHYDVVLRLLQAGADIDAMDDRGRSPLHYAVILGHKELVMALLSFGANQTICSIDGWTILHTAAHCGWGHIVDVLLQSGGNVNGRVLECFPGAISKIMF